MIALIDYGAGNLHSVEKALRFVGGDVRRVTRPEALAGARAAVLPGVGAFDDCLNALRRLELQEATRDFVRSGRPFLGICVGYQALFEKSDEFNSCAAGLEIYKGKVVRFAGGKGLKVPQIGWNQIEITRPDCPLYRGIPTGSFVYFVHSFFPRPEEGSLAATLTEYGESFVSSIWQGSLFATQFHPEKSQKVGLRMLRNFLDFAERGT